MSRASVELTAPLCKAIGLRQHTPCPLIRFQHPAAAVEMKHTQTRSFQQRRRSIAAGVRRGRRLLHLNEVCDTGHQSFDSLYVLE